MAMIISAFAPFTDENVSTDAAIKIIVGERLQCLCYPRENQMEVIQDIGTFRDMNTGTPGESVVTGDENDA